MKFRFVIFSLVSLVCVSPVMGNQLTEQEFTEILIRSLLEQASTSRSPKVYSLEERAQRRAELVQQAQEIRSQMYSAKQERLLKCVSYGSMATLLAATCVATIAAKYMERKGIAYDELDAKLKHHGITQGVLFALNKKILSEFNNEWWSGLKTALYSLGAAAVSLVPVGYSGPRLDLQNSLTAKLEEIKKEIAEIDALNAAEAPQDATQN